MSEEAPPAGLCGIKECTLTPHEPRTLHSWSIPTLFYPLGQAAVFDDLAAIDDAGHFLYHGPIRE